MRIVVTGAAGFVGSHATEYLTRKGHDVVATDVAEIDPPSDFSYIRGALENVLDTVLPNADAVWHFAANTDIPLGAVDTAVDMQSSVILTRLLLERMRHHDVGRIVFPSTSGVYGASSRAAVSESFGPLLPNSMHAAGKLATEGLISAYAYTFGMQACITRLGNVVGGGMRRGVIRDFLSQLRLNSSALHVRGDGQQRKSYVLVEDVVRGMNHLSSHAERIDQRVAVFNLGAGDSLSIHGVVEEICRAIGISLPAMTFEGGLSWPGDQPFVELNIERATAAGWAPTAGGARHAVRQAALRLSRDVGGFRF